MISVSFLPLIWDELSRVFTYHLLIHIHVDDRLKDVRVTRSVVACVLERSGSEGAYLQSSQWRCP